MKDKKDHHNRLQYERLVRGWTQEYVAEELEVDVRTVRRWENGHPVRPGNALSLIRLFEKSAVDLGLIVEIPPKTASIADSLSPEDPYLFQTNPGSLKHNLPKGTFASSHPTTFPVPSTPLIGREQEMAVVKQLLYRDEVRLLTLTGPGGTGKTCLGVHVVEELQDLFADGIFFVNLAPISDATLVATTIAQALGILEVVRQPILEGLKAYLQDKQLLLLLDNFEHVMEAAVQVTELLVSCHKLKILVTSREVLHVQAEQEFMVPPLATPDRSYLTDQPDLMTLSNFPAVKLFILRAQATKPDFQINLANSADLIKICTRLDGLPLAIELAAARIKLLAPQSLLKWLDNPLLVLTTGARDAPIRHQTLRNTITWSYDLLSAEEQRLFRQLSTCVSGFTLETVVAMGAVLGVTAVSVLDRVGSLIDKSLLQPMRQVGGEEQRFMMLETIRDYGLEALAVNGEMKNTRQAHALTFLEFAEKAEQELGGPQQVVWLERLEQEHDNLRAAMRWFLEQGETEEVGRSTEMALQLGVYLLRFWLIRGHWSEGYTYLEQALSLSEENAKTVRAKAIYAAGCLALAQSDFGRTVAHGEESLVLFRELRDKRGAALALHLLGRVARRRGNFTAARALNEEALEHWREVGDERGIISLLDISASMALELGDYIRARILLEEGLAFWRGVGNKEKVANSLWLLARVFLFQSDCVKAHSLLEESLNLAIEVGDKGSIANAQLMLGFVAFLRAEYATSRELFEESMTLFREVGDQRGMAVGIYGLAWISLSQVDYAAAHALYEESLKILRRIDNKWFIILCVEGLGATAALQKQFARAARLWGAAQNMREIIGLPMPPLMQTTYEQIVNAAHSSMGEEAFAVAWAEGKAMSLEQVLVAGDNQRYP